MMQQRQVTMPHTLRFPLEVVLRIVSHMNHYTVINFLKCAHEYQRYAVLVTDHPDTAFFFFNLKSQTIPHVCDMASVKVCGLISGVPFTPDIAKDHPIKLFEIKDHPNGPWSTHLLSFERNFPVRTFRQMDVWHRNPDINCTSFLYVDIVHVMRYFQKHIDPVLDRLESKTGCKVHYGLPTFFPQFGIMMPGRQTPVRYGWRANENALALCNQLVEPSCLANFSALRLENVPVVDDLKLPGLNDLILVYDTGSVETPIIQNLSAPNLRRFVVHYDRQVPVFKKMSAFGKGKLMWETKRGLRQDRKNWIDNGSQVWDPELSRRFELCHIGEYGSSASSYQNNQTPGTLIRKKSFSFLRYFHIVFLTGVPWSAFGAMQKLYSLRKLYLTLTDVAQAPLPDRFIVDSPLLHHLVLTIKADDVRVPKFAFQKLKCLTIRIMGLNPDLSAFWDSRVDGYGVSYFHIFSDPNLCIRALHTGKRMILASDGGWIELAYSSTKYRRQYIQNPVKLYGFPEDESLYRQP